MMHVHVCTLVCMLSMYITIVLSIDRPDRRRSRDPTRDGADATGAHRARVGCRQALRQGRRPGFPVAIDRALPVSTCVLSTEPVPIPVRCSKSARNC